MMVMADERDRLHIDIGRGQLAAMIMMITFYDGIDVWFWWY